MDSSRVLRENFIYLHNASGDMFKLKCCKVSFFYSFIYVCRRFLKIILAV